MSVRAYINFCGCCRAVLLPSCPLTAISTNSCNYLRVSGHLPRSEDGELLTAKRTYLPHEQNPGSAE